MNEREQNFVDKMEMAAAITTYDIDNPIILAANRAHEKLTEWPTSVAAGQNPKIFKGQLTEGMKSWQIKESLRNSDCWSGDITNYKKSGVPYRVNITIFPVLIDGAKRYIAVKRALGLFG